MDKLLYEVSLMDDTINSIYAKQRDNRRKIEELVYEMVNSKGGTIKFIPDINGEYCHISLDGELQANVCSISANVDEIGHKTFDVSLEDERCNLLDETYQAYRMDFNELTDVFDLVKYKCYGTI